MTTNTNTNAYSNVNQSTSTLRPRNARLISYLGEESNCVDAASNAVSTSALASRDASPSTRAQPRSATGSSRTQPSGQLKAASTSTDRRPSSGLWDSWSQLQGIASSILGSDATANTASSTSGSLKSPVWMKQDHTYTTSKSSGKWGLRAPSANATGSGAAEDRQSLIQAKKREALLLSAIEDTRDRTGRFKRKGSNASLTLPSSALDLDEDALVYRHKVQPSDTMAGIAIKYSCQPEIFRKVNRLWPNDRVQIRSHVLLPVDACAIKGRKIDGQAELDALNGTEEEAMKRVKRRSEQSGSPETALSDTDTEQGDPLENDGNRDFQHDSWISVPNFEQPVQILRISRSTLGYFPPARRKSHHLSVTESANASARSSFETLRHPPTHAAQQAQRHQQQMPHSLNSSPIRRPPSLTRQRSTSTVATTSTSNSFLRALHGPGGVGTLRGLRTEISRPGPADDPLNQRFPQFAPSFAPPPVFSEHADGPSSLLRGVTLSIAPRASTDSIRSTRSGRSNSSTSVFGTGVENWVKKLAGGTRPGVNRTNSDRIVSSGNASIASGLGIGGETGLGDLIELESNTGLLSLNTTIPDNGSITDHDDGEETPRMGTAERVSGTRADASKSLKQSEQDLMNERFPVRGRVTRAYAGD